MGDITEGEPVGEFAFFTNDPRSATVFAMRPSVVLEINENEYYKIISLQPEFAQKLTAITIKRLKSNSLQDNIKNAPKNIAIINLQENPDLTPWTQLIENQFLKSGINYKLHNRSDLKDENYDAFFQKLEENDSLNFFVCNLDQPEWSKQCCIYSDLVIIAAEFDGKHEIYEIENDLELYKDNVLRKKIYLLLLHPENSPHAKNTKKWLEKRKIDLHIHFRKHHTRDAARFCRIITNKAVGLVLGGGGAKGYAHFGAIRALLEEGIQIDFLGGTSSGAFSGLTVSSLDFDFEKIKFYEEDPLNKNLTKNDYTFPVISLLTGKKIKKYVQKLFGDLCLEDFWAKTYCVSSNFSSAQLSMHEEGLASKKVLASAAIPGVFPPEIIDYELHVDGGVMDNLPIQSMYKFPVGYIIAISLSSSTLHKSEHDDTPSNPELLLDKLLLRKKYKLPSMSSIIINSLTLNSVQRQIQNKSNATFYLELNLKGFGFLDDSKWKEILQQGHNQMKEFIKNVNPSEKFWK
ncbi:MAG: hypothetical protein HOP11_04215 [Saprospiraceae bacterium]|nr:hypothetical protein [Saprospiraceae bacterium]